MSARSSNVEIAALEARLEVVEAKLGLRDPPPPPAAPKPGGKKLELDDSPEPAKAPKK